MPHDLAIATGFRATRDPPGNPYLKTSLATSDPTEGSILSPAASVKIGTDGALPADENGALGTGTGVGTATAVGAVDCCFLSKSEAVPTPTARPTAKMPPWMIGLPGMFADRWTTCGNSCVASRGESRSTLGYVEFHSSLNATRDRLLDIYREAGPRISEYQNMVHK